MINTFKKLQHHNQHKYFLGGICNNIIFYTVLHNPQCLSEKHIYKYSINIFQIKTIRYQIVINSIAHMEKICIKFIQDEKLQCSLQIAKDPCYKKMLEEKMKMEGYGEIPTCFLCLQLSLRQQRKLL